jgi:hypothetical protein
MSGPFGTPQTVPPVIPQIPGLVIRSGLEALVDDVGAFFKANSMTAVVAFGQKERTKQINQGPGTANRVVFIPHDEQGDGGELLEEGSPGAWREIRDAAGVLVGRVRQAGIWERVVGVSVWGYDPTTDTERAHYAAVEALLERTRAAIKWSQAGGGNARWDRTKTRWTVAPVELKHGAEVQVWFRLRTPLFDVAEAVGFPQGTAVARPTNLSTVV